MTDHVDQRTFLEYHGTAGATKECAEAVERLLLGRVKIQAALILSHQSSHALLLTNTQGDEIVIKSGFTSGYGGVGPKGFSATLGLLKWHGVELEEILIDEGVYERLEASALTIADLDVIASAVRLRPRRLWDYILDEDQFDARNLNPWQRRNLAVPLALIDNRLATVARDFWDDPDGNLLKAHRQLEEIVRLRTKMTLDEAKDGPSATYRFAFGGAAPRLTWPNTSQSEHAGRMNLFMGVLTAYRHVRVHRTETGNAEAQLCELLLLNHLYRLEAEAEESQSDN